jgi:pilus assembly protein CpaB
MRAVTVRVNDVVGVAGFVLPGMRVDVTVTGRPPAGTETLTTTVLQNITVLSAGQTMAPDARGAAINAPTVTLLVTPEQAEVIILAGSEGRIQLILRNGSDNDVQKTSGVTTQSLYGKRGAGPRMPGGNNNSNDAMGDDGVAPRRRIRPTPPPVVVAATPPPAPVLPPVPEQIVVIRGNARSVETVGMKPGSGSAPPAPVAIP